MRVGKSIFGFVLISIWLSAASLAGFAQQNKTLRALAEKRGIYVGAAVAIKPLKKEPLYRETIEREFNIVVAENAFKWGLAHPKKSKFNFKDTDWLVEFAEKNRMKLRGHTLVWHRQNPKWLTEGDFTRDELIRILNHHIQTLVGRYRGKILAWDVVNEAIDDKTGDYRTDSFWYQKLGADYIRLAFEFAREADPNAKLYYNDYSAEGMNAKSDGIYKMLRELKNQGVPVDGVGWQMHLINGFRIEPQHSENARRLSALGLELSITEMDVRLKLPATPDELRKQADAYRDVANFCLAEASCKALLIWGVTDKYSWIPREFPDTGDALIFDAFYKPKPSYAALLEAFEQTGNNRK
ncbi:MAG: endo-1,4-beta-xylanase [Acidobacteriota bacterium]|nr:endo-1,4-beta-xylanase [Acidobacteriota bacterium]